MRPRRTRRSVMRARWPPRKMTGEFSTLAHIIAPAMLATPGPSVPMHSPGLPVIREAASAMKPALSSWCGATTGPAARLRLEEHVDEVRVRDAEQRVDTLGLKQVQNAFVDGYSHIQCSSVMCIGV